MKNEEKKQVISDEELRIEEMTIEKLAKYVAVKYFDSDIFRVFRRFNRLRDSDVFATLARLDPFKEPTQVARVQGMRDGFYDFEVYVDREYKKLRMEEGVEKEKKDEK